MGERREWTTASVPAKPVIDAGDPTAGFVLVFSRDFEVLPAAVSFAGDALTVGREPDNTLPLPDGSVSRYHARFERRDGGVWVGDLGSTNGTIVNGRYVMEALLADGDLVRIGDTLLKFVARDLMSYRAYRIDGAVDDAVRPVPRSGGQVELIGGLQIDRIVSDIEKIAASDLSVVIRGESGTGKELVARELHRLSGRRGAFQAINCGALHGNLIESELFGHKRGSFSGAVADKVGIVKAADHGTLFLDEIGEMPVESQVKLLRVIQEREVQPIGGTQTERVDVRFVAATNRDLNREVERGKFRPDLFARLNEFSIELPPLRQRKEDAYLLTRHFLAKHGKPATVPSFTLMLAITHYDWPYNVRELESALRRAAALCPHGAIDVAHLPDVVQQALRTYANRGPAKPGYVPEAEATRVAVAAVPAAPRITRRSVPSAEELREALARTGGNISAIAREYNKDRVQIHRWLRRYAIDPAEYRTEPGIEEPDEDRDRG
ncbi:MAG: sigma 54-interacting transcriptional regulator [Deltaproteobacteria bacterium]|nr:sigma 54-interacting transcriptional regulator [Deltaproteobacteria bacterium]